MENYLMLNGQRIELTNSQYKEIMNAIGDPAPTKQNPFERRKTGDYYLINDYGGLDWTFDSMSKFDNLRYENANYCFDKDLLTQRAFYEKVERNLWRFSMGNGGSGNYFLQFNGGKGCWDWNIGCIFKNFGPSFVSKEVAIRAIEEVLKTHARKRK